LHLAGGRGQLQPAAKHLDGRWPWNFVPAQLRAFLQRNVGDAQRALPHKRLPRTFARGFCGQFFEP
jgi:hypothetical protein